MINRREFLKKSVQAGAGALLIGSALEACTRVAATNNIPIVGKGPFVLPELPYATHSLAPHIDAMTMEIHHTKHHQGYINKLNAALEGYPDQAKRPLEELLGDLQNLPKELAGVVRNHGGGHYNHSLFWQCLTPKTEQPSKPLEASLVQTFGSMDAFKNAFEASAKNVFGSGWAWLVNTADGTLAITTSANQDNPLLPGASIPGKPLLGVDVWEHAYYLNYQNRRGDYLKAFWNVVNWGFVSKQFT